MFVLKLKLNTTAQDRQLLEKRFGLMNLCHNVLVKHAGKHIGLLRRDREYQKTLKAYLRAKDTDDKPRTKALGKTLNGIVAGFGLTESELEKYIAPWQKQHREHLSSFQCQKEASRVYAGVQKVLYSNGKHLHFHRKDDQHTICGKDTKNGIRFDPVTMKINYLGQIISCHSINPSDLYKTSAFSMIKEDLSNVSYYEISREAFGGGWHYYLNIYIREASPKKQKYGEAVTGIDPGVSTMACVSDNRAVLAELAPKQAEYDRKIRSILRSMDRSRRANNPEKYNADGTVKKNCGRFRRSGNYTKLLRKLRMMHRKKAAYTKQSHEMLANDLISDSVYFYAEEMTYSGLAKRSGKEAERSDFQFRCHRFFLCSPYMCKCLKRSELPRLYVNHSRLKSGDSCADCH